MTPEAIAALLLSLGYTRRPSPRNRHLWSKPDGTRAYGTDLYAALRPHLVPMDPFRLYGFDSANLARVAEEADRLSPHA